MVGKVEGIKHATFICVQWMSVEFQIIRASALEKAIACDDQFCQVNLSFANCCSLDARVGFGDGGAVL